MTVLWMLLVAVEVSVVVGLVVPRWARRRREWDRFAANLRDLVAALERAELAVAFRRMAIAGRAAAAQLEVLRMAARNAGGAE